MTHELTALHLSSAVSDIEFLQSYLGADLYSKVDKLFKTTSMPREVLGVYRKTAELMAELIPEADQVVRDDVTKNAAATPRDIGGYLAVYFGVQTPAFDTRHQFIGLAFHPDRPDQPWTFFIAGALVESNLRSLITESPATQALNGYALKTTQDLELIKPQLEAVARLYQVSISARKRGGSGVIPATAYKLQQYINKHFKANNTQDREQEAKEIAYAYFNKWTESLTPVEKAALKTKFMSKDEGIYWNKFVQMIFSGYPAEEAFEIVIKMLNQA
jgi:hypothetical protein